MFDNNQILNRAIAEKYPGALWLPELAACLALSGAELITGDVALHQVKTGQLSPLNVWVIQDDMSANADALIELGAIPKVLLCAESPLFAANFYRDLPTISRYFEHCILFRGVLNDAQPLIAKHVLWFPSFLPEQISQPVPWSERKHLVMVAGNKYWKIHRTLWRSMIANMRDVIRPAPQRFSKAYASAQLHDLRLAVIAHFGTRSELDLFGNGWNDLGNLPSHWQKEVAGVIKNLLPRPCEDKRQVISRYKFAVCFENIEFPGYVTEKILDSLVAGVIPVYWGAPDIADFVPEGCYVDARQFVSLDALSQYLQELPESQGLAIIERGQAFLRGEGASMFSYGSFAARIVQMLITQ